MNFSLHLLTLRLIYKLIVSISTAMDKTLQRLKIVRELGEKIKKIPIDINFSNEEFEKNLQRLEKKHTTGIAANHRYAYPSAQLQSPPRPVVSEQQLIALDSNRQRNFYQPIEGTDLALANFSGSKESQEVAQVVKNSPEKNEGKIVPTVPAPSNILSNLNQQQNLNKQPSDDGSLSGGSKDNIEKKAKPEPAGFFSGPPSSGNLLSFPSATTSRPNMFTKPINQQPKKSVQPASLYENIPSKTTNEPPVPIIKNKSQESPQKQPQAKQKMEKPPAFNAIGPGGQNVQMKPFYLNDNNNKKRNIFCEENNKENKNASAEPQPFKTNLSQTVTTAPNLFQNKPEPAGFFSGPPSSGNLLSFPSATTGFFGQPTSNLLAASPPSNIFPSSQSSCLLGGSQPASKPLLGNSTTTQPKQQDDEDQAQFQVIFKETASKITDEDNTQEETYYNVDVLIQKHQESGTKSISVYIANKFSFFGNLIPGITEIRVLNNNPRNVAVKNILNYIENSYQQPRFVGVKIQFKEDSIGERFKQEVEQAIANPA